MRRQKRGLEECPLNGEKGAVSQRRQAALDAEKIRELIFFEPPAGSKPH